MIQRTLLAVLLVAVALAATACGTNPATPAAQTGDNSPGAAAVPTTGAPQATDSVPTTAPASSAASDKSPYAGLEQGRTSEGYHVLGSANAPVTLVMYSDFF